MSLPAFPTWETRWRANQRDINNPKIPVRFVEQNGQLVYQFDETSAG